MKDFYQNDSRNLAPTSNKKLNKKQRRAHIIENLTNCIEIEYNKIGHGNKELVKKLQEKVDILKEKK